jgi:hypothetical protein
MVERVTEDWSEEGMMWFVNKCELLVILFDVFI